MGNAATQASAYLQGWHERHPGATATALSPMVDERGRSSYEVLVGALDEGADPVLDLACGDGPLLGLLAGRAALGADASAAELDGALRRLGPGAPLLRADAARLPVATGALGAVGCHFALMLLQPLEQVLAELGRVLRPSGLLVAVLPAAPPDDAPTPVTVFRTAWDEVTRNHPVEVPPLQDARALQPDAIAALLHDAGFSAVTSHPVAVATAMTPLEAEESLLLTYLPDLLSASGYADLRRKLGRGLAALADADGRLRFVQHATLLTARSGAQAATEPPQRSAL